MQTEIQTAAESAMHTLLHVDADMGERIEAAHRIAIAMDLPWPPYSGVEGDSLDDDAANDGRTLVCMECGHVNASMDGYVAGQHVRCTGCHGVIVAQVAPTGEEEAGDA